MPDEIDEVYAMNVPDTSISERKSDALQRLQEKAEAMNSGSNKSKSDKPAKKKLSLDDLTKKAESMQ